VRFVRAACIGWLLLLCGGSAFGQDRSAPPLAMTLAASAKTSEGCGPTMAAAIQPNLEAQLRALGMTLSRVHNATLLAETNCEPTEQGTANAARISVRECLSLSQVVRQATHANGMSLDTTWRKCSAIVCAPGKCDTSALTAQKGLVADFVSHLRETAPQAAQEDAAAVPPPEDPAPVNRVVMAATMYEVAPPPDRNLRTVFYAAYILTCVVLFARRTYFRHG
jgi:hypothetical protein